MRGRGRSGRCGTLLARIALGAFVACVAIGAATALAAEGALPDAFRTVVIDAGHGGDDEGATGPSGLHEKELVLDVSQRLDRRLRALEIQTVLTRSEDVFVPLEERTSLANDARASLFISIHANASPLTEVKGIETYFASLEYSDEAARQIARRENEVFGAAAEKALSADPLHAILGDMMATEHMRESSEFASLAQSRLAAISGESSRGVKQAPFVVLMGVQMPAALIEIGFVSNATEEKALRRAKHRDAIVDAIAQAVVEFGKQYDERRGVHERLSSLKREPARP